MKYVFVAICAFMLSGCYENKAEEHLRSNGYSNIVIKDSGEFHVCMKGHFQVHFSAKKNGRHVDGAVCSGVFSYVLED